MPNISIFETTYNTNLGYSLKTNKLPQIKVEFKKWSVMHDKQYNNNIEYSI